MIEALSATHADMIHTWLEGLCWVLGGVFLLAIVKALSPYIKQLPKDSMNIVKVISAYFTRMLEYKSGHGNHAQYRGSTQPHAELKGSWQKSETGGYRYVAGHVPASV